MTGDQRLPGLLLVGIVVEVFLVAGNRTGNRSGTNRLQICHAKPGERGAWCYAQRRGQRHGDKKRQDDLCNSKAEAKVPQRTLLFGRRSLNQN
jgi:hypothetical protein